MNRQGNGLGALAKGTEAPIKKPPRVWRACSAPYIAALRRGFFC